jgi:hypothetical protein
MNTAPEPTRPHSRSVLKGFEERAMTRVFGTDKGMVRSDMSKPALIFFSLQEYTQQNPVSKF